MTTRKTTTRRTIALPRFAPVYRRAGRNECLNLRFSRLGDCDSFDVCEAKPLPSWASMVGERF